VGPRCVNHIEEEELVVTALGLVAGSAIGSRKTRPINMKHPLTCSHCGRPTISVNVSTGTCWECSFPRE
jgi:ribosomal protein L37E